MYRRKKKKKHVIAVCLINEIITGGAGNIGPELSNTIEIHINVLIFIILKEKFHLKYLFPLLPLPPQQTV